jgi:uncharacterized delta-60 repeat protein
VQAILYKEIPMMWPKLLNLWRTTARPSRRRPAFRRQSCRLCLETLEDRWVPSAPLDPTFGTGGIVTTALPNFSDNPQVLGDLLQPNGDIIAYGTGPANNTLFLVRYTPSGSLDTSFGNAGIVENATMGGSPKAALQANGQIVVVGSGQLVRYESNGSLDTTFGSNGIVTLPSNFVTRDAFGGAFAGVLIQPSNGDIVIGGSSGSDFALVAYTPNGSLDTTFGTGGEVLTPGGGRFTTLALDNSDVLAGGVIQPGVSGAVARYTPSGSLDTTFGSSGIVTTPMAVRSLVVQPSGQIVAVGTGGGTHGAWTLARYNPDGTLDSTFGHGGVVTSNPDGNDVATGAVLESDGLIVVVGLGNTEFAELGVYNPNGNPDVTFGTAGFVVTQFWSAPNYYAGDGLVIQPNGDLVIASSDGGAIALARYLPPVPQTSPSFFITGPTTLTAGTAATFTLSTLNPDNTADTGYSGTVQITSSDPQAGLPGNVVITGGTGSFTVTLKTAGLQSVTATDVTNSSITGEDTPTTVNPAAASQVIFFPAPSNGTVGKPVAIQAAIADAYGNIETGDNTDQITIRVNSGPSSQVSGTLTETVSRGSATFSLTFDTAGTYTLAAVADLAGGGTLGPDVSPSFDIVKRHH